MDTGHWRTAYWKYSARCKCSEWPGRAPESGWADWGTGQAIDPKRGNRRCSWLLCFHFNITCCNWLPPCIIASIEAAIEANIVIEYKSISSYYPSCQVHPPSGHSGASYTHVPALCRSLCASRATRPSYNHESPSPWLPGASRHEPLYRCISPCTDWVPRRVRHGVCISLVLACSSATSLATLFSLRRAPATPNLTRAVAPKLSGPGRPALPPLHMPDICHICPHLIMSSIETVIPLALGTHPAPHPTCTHPLSTSASPYTQLCWASLHALPSPSADVPTPPSLHDRPPLTSESTPPPPSPRRHT